MSSHRTAEHVAAPGSRVALWILVALAVALPWAFGGVQPRVERWATQASLLTCAYVLLRQASAGAVHLTRAWLLLLPLGLSCAQLIPLPHEVIGTVAPGVVSTWWPEDAAAGAVLGAGWHPLTVNPAGTWSWLFLATGTLLLALLATPALVVARRALRPVATLVLGAAALAIFGVAGRFHFGNRLYGMWEVPTIAPYGPFVSKNHFAGYVGMAAFMGVGWALCVATQSPQDARPLGWTTSRKGAGVAVAACAAAVCALGAIASLSRGGFLCLVGGSLALVAARWRWLRSAQRRQLLAAGLGLAVISATLWVATPSAAKQRFASILGATREASGAYRLDVWRDTATMWARSPLTGHGVGAFADAYPRYKTEHGHLRVAHAENEYLQFAAEAGVLGVGSVVWALLALLRSRSAWTGGKRLDALSLGALAGLAGLALHSVVDFNLRIPSNAYLAAALLALVLAGAPVCQPLLGPARWLPGVLVLALLLQALRMPSDPRPTHEEIQALAGLARGEAELREARVDAQASGALRTRPANPEVWLLLSWLRLSQGRQADASALAAHAIWLDPLRPEVSTLAAQIRAQAGSVQAGPNQN